MVGALVAKALAARTSTYLELRAQRVELVHRALHLLRQVVKCEGGRRCHLGGPPRRLA